MKSDTLTCLALTSLIMMGCTSVTSSKQIERKHYNEWEKTVGYTQVVRVGEILHLSGLGGDGETQAEQINSIYKTISEILADYNATTQNIVKEVIYSTNIDELIDAQEIRKAYFPSGQYPASTWVQIERLYSPDMKVEVDVTVHIP